MKWDYTPEEKDEQAARYFKGTYEPPPFPETVKGWLLYLLFLTAVIGAMVYFVRGSA